jgi:hypothetical protein
MRLLPVFLLPALLAAEPPGWTDLLKEPEKTFKGPLRGWYQAGEVELKGKEGRRLNGKKGTGALVNGPDGREPDLYTKDSYGDVEVELSFLLARGSNSGVKFHGLYEIQICDSYLKMGKLDGSDCGGIYPRANLLPTYRHIDSGVAPKVNACKPSGEWQELTAIFQAPRFKDGKKVANARMVKATLNGKVIHEGQEMATPTGHNWTRKEMEKGPLMLQGDHGPVAFRNVRVRPWMPK